MEVSERDKKKRTKKKQIFISALNLLSQMRCMHFKMYHQICDGAQRRKSRKRKGKNKTVECRELSAMTETDIEK